ncbi:MAG: C25 family cysteine peptidase, partial [Blastocatellia bacterium]
EIEQIREAVKGVPCQAVKLIEEFLGGIPKLRDGERTPFAEDLYNRGHALRRDVVRLIPKGDPCATTPRFDRQPAIDILASDNKQFHASISFGEPILSSVKAGGEVFTQLEIPGVQSGLGEAGTPAVPVFNRMIALPQGAKANISFKPGKTSTLKLNLYPIQPEAADPAKDRNPEFPKFEEPKFTKNKAAYEKNADFPANVCTITPAGKARELELAQISCAAAQYNPVTDELKHFESIEIEVGFRGGAAGFVSQSLANSFENLNSYLSTVINAGIIPNFTFPDLRKYFCAGEEYLILTHPDFRAAADRLAQWKNSKGIATRVMNVNDGNGPGPDTKEAIDELIESRYGRCLTRVSYVLLLGDAEFIPTFYRDTMFSDVTGTDYPYALLGDDDETPDFALGRIPVDTLAEADIVVDKVIKYESDPPSRSSFYKNVGMASQFQCCRTDVAQEGRDQRQFIETTEIVRNHLLGEGYGAKRIYTETVDNAYNGDTTPRRFRDGTLLPEELRASNGFAWNGDTNDIIDEWNAGRFLFLHRDHGWKYGWGHPDFDSNNVVNDLNNGELLPVVFSVNCSSGLFDNETANGEYGTDVDEVYFAEHLLRKANGGAVGMLGDTRDSPTVQNNILTRGFFDAIWPDLLPDFGDGVSKRRLGDILNHGKLFLISSAGLPAITADLDGSAAASELYLWHVLGDPTLEMWTKRPLRFFIKDFSVFFNTNYLRVKYELENALITAYQETKEGIVPIGRGEVKKGEAILPFIQKPLQGVQIQLAASVENDVSRKLTK